MFKKNNIHYFALGGTMLGAVRHKGFVPWDDDIDIGIPREDYERLLQLKAQLPNHLRLLSYPHDSSYPYYIARVVDERVMVKSDRTEIDEITPAWIDIFPLDGMPKNNLLRKLHEKRILFARMLFQISRFDDVVNTKRTNRPRSEKILIRLSKSLHLQQWIGRKHAFFKLDRILKSWPYKTADHNINAMGAYKLREEFSKEVFGNGALYFFEDIQIRGPQDYETYLTQLYGDWRTPADFSHHGTIEILHSKI